MHPGDDKKREPVYQSDPDEARKEYRAHTTLFYNREQRRRIAKQCGVMAHPGLFATLLNEEERELLDSKTYHKEDDAVPVRG